MTSKVLDTAGETWELVEPQVNAEAEFYEISNDFGEPLELIREAISNAIDAEATWIKIATTVERVEGNKRLVIELSDNGKGMTREVLAKDFWGLGFSQTRDKKDTKGRKIGIGEKGHGTKIYLRSESVTVKTQSSDGAFISECLRPLSALSRRELHEPRIRPIEKFLPEDLTGTEIRIVGYNDNDRSRFVKDIIEDYILWFTKVGSIELMFDIKEYEDFKVYLKCVGEDDFAPINFGHVFPPESDDITKLFNERDTAAADWYVKRYKWSERLKRHTEVTFQAIISVEGDEVKRKFNPMIRERRRSETGRYRVSDRYGIWLCKDFIPVVRVNDWITGFGSGSNAYVLLHGFINCQELKLTANRGTIANTDPKILEELRSTVQELVSEIDVDLNRNGLYTLRGWQEEERTLKQEKAEFDRRVKNLKGKKVATLDGRLLIEPRNESELFGLLIVVYALRPDLFAFEPLDYDTSRGIDIIARNKSDNRITEGEHSYIELKHTLRTRFNHAFRHLRWIVCWDFDKNIGNNSEFHGIEDTDVRYLKTAKNEEGHSIYFLDNQSRLTKIQVIRLKELLKQRLNLEFQAQA